MTETIMLGGLCYLMLKTVFLELQIFRLQCKQK